MEGFPPSYQHAVASLKDHWSVIASYVPSGDLYTACLVSKKWYEVFSPLLWGNPTSHFDDEAERRYEALFRFRSFLDRTRSHVRQLTHTLHLPSARIDFYDGTHPRWLRDILFLLPNLQTLIVSGIPSFDYQALQALGHSPTFLSPSFATELPLPFNTLKLLDASYCPNITVQGLLQILSYFPNLVYLDLSQCTGVRHYKILSKLGHMPELQVLKLRRCGLRNTGLEEVTHSIGVRLRCLDLTGNYLDDGAIDHLLESCHPRDTDIASLQPSYTHVRSAMNDASMEEASIRGPKRLLKTLQEIQKPQFDNYLMQQLTTRAFHHLALQDLPTLGIMHLYLSDNLFSAKGISKLIAKALLVTLDVGNLVSSQCTLQNGVRGETVRVEAEGIALSLAHHHSDLKYFRVHHTLVSKISPSSELFKSLHVLDLPITDFSVEEPAPDYDWHAEGSNDELSSRDNQRDKATMSEGTPNAATNDPALEKDPKAIRSEPVSRAPYSPNRQKQYSTWPSSEPQALKDVTLLMLKDVVTLVLTNIPSREDTLNASPISAAIINFIAIVAEYGNPDRYTHPDLKHVYEHHSPRDPTPKRRPSPLALQQIVLEIGSSSRSLSIANQTTPLSPSHTLSSTEDPDSENFWAAAESDYSFFGDDEKVKLPKSSTFKAGKQVQAAVPEGKDIVQEIANFRRERKEQYERDRMEARDYTWGNWKGEVRIIRHVS